MALFTDLITFSGIAWAAISNTWWIWLPPGLFFAGKKVYAYYLRVRYFANVEWIDLEVRIPRDIQKTPEAMEQLFGGLQTMIWNLDPLEIWWEGLQRDYIVFELVSLEGEVHFFIHTPKFFKNVVENHLYAQYPEAEIIEVEDYLKKIPVDVPSATWDIFGLEFFLVKEDAFPIRTYRDFASMEPGQEEFLKVDPFSSMTEVFGKIGPGEFMTYQLIFQPAQDDRWKEEGEAMIKKLAGEKPVEKKSPMAVVGREIISAITGIPSSPKEQKKETFQFKLIPANIDEQIKAISRNITKPGFETVIRYTYIAKRDRFLLSHLSSFIGALKQYNTLTLNSLKLNSAAMATATQWWWPPFLRRKIKLDKKKTYYKYWRLRKKFTETVLLKSKKIILNSEELATLFHFPSLGTKSPLLPRLPSRRSEPPPALPM